MGDKEEVKECPKEKELDDREDGRNRKGHTVSDSQLESNVVVRLQP